MAVVIADKQTEGGHTHLDQEEQYRIVLNQRGHQRIAFGSYSAADVPHSSDSIITGHCDRSEDISEQLEILNGDSGPCHGQPLLLSLFERATGNGAPKLLRAIP